MSETRTKLTKGDVDAIVADMMTAIRPLLPQLVANEMKHMEPTRCLLDASGANCAFHGRDCALGTLVAMSRP